MLLELTDQWKNSRALRLLGSTLMLAPLFPVPYNLFPSSLLPLVFF